MKSVDIKDYLYKNKEIPYWEEEVISICEKIISEVNEEWRARIDKRIEEILDMKVNEDNVKFYNGMRYAYTELLEAE